MNCYSHMIRVVSCSITGSKKERMGKNIKGKEPPPIFPSISLNETIVLKINWYAS